MSREAVYALGFFGLALMLAAALGLDIVLCSLQHPCKFCRWSHFWQGRRDRRRIRKQLEKVVR